ncbi:hypothetical protein [Deinococcus maricopensis]|uniref:Uncharacterized protein n=1 Tax=Deinococcus maricopensis (strain DSM 21211 / LMG 22137 / NRRL B-23946 / LB-34) TaxID=709986 RepID=E8U7T5_DEIML|nr:hypothetical protein [Deinococcus maricopensis]ADV67124.1 hypothetical protein Deima_1475 [Deinococcus maricopensis DSM 21211]
MGALPHPDAFTFTLSVNGRGAGEQAWSVAHDKTAVIARVQTDFGGVLPAVRRVQTSRMHPRAGTSLAYAEGDGRTRASFETHFDRKAGLVTLRQGREEVSAPLVSDHHDPVSLLLWLRSATEDLTHADVRMVGGRVHVQRLPDSEVGGVAARAYTLRPGGALVFVEAHAPHRLLRLVQPTDFGSVDALLVGSPAAEQFAREAARERDGGVRARRRR